MQIPIKPPDINEIITNISSSRLFLPEMRNSAVKNTQTRYRRWDELRHRKPPEGYTLEQWLAAIKLSRFPMEKELPFTESPTFSTPDCVLQKLHWIDQGASGSMLGENSLVSSQTKGSQLIHSLMDEAIDSSRLEGAATTRRVAKEMIRKKKAGLRIRDRNTYALSRCFVQHRPGGPARVIG